MQLQAQNKSPTKPRLPGIAILDQASKRPHRDCYQYKRMKQ